MLILVVWVIISRYRLFHHAIAAAAWWAELICVAFFLAVSIRETGNPFLSSYLIMKPVAAAACVLVSKWLGIRICNAGSWHETRDTWHVTRDISWHTHIGTIGSGRPRAWHEDSQDQGISRTHGRRVSKMRNWAWHCCCLQPAVSGVFYDAG